MSIFGKKERTPLGGGAKDYGEQIRDLVNKDKELIERKVKIQENLEGLKKFLIERFVGPEKGKLMWDEFQRKFPLACNDVYRISTMEETAKTRKDRRMVKKEETRAIKQYQFFGFLMENKGAVIDWIKLQSVIARHGNTKKRNPLESYLYQSGKANED